MSEREESGWRGPVSLGELQSEEVLLLVRCIVRNHFVHETLHPTFLQKCFQCVLSEAFEGLASGIRAASVPQVSLEVCPPVLLV